jgi:esterase
MNLVHFKTYGEVHLPPLYIAHGVFGMLDNWHNIAQNLSSDYFVVCFDARNHGKSFHHTDASFVAMVDDLFMLSEHLKHPTFILMGHSMGGKMAMKFVDTYPQKVSKLIVVDIAPKTYKPSHLAFIRAFKEIPFDRIANRKDADIAFSEYSKDLAIRQFLLKNLESKPEGGYQLRINIEAIEKHYYEIIGEVSFQGTHSLPTCFISGELSSYILPEDHAIILHYFPQTRFYTIEKAGHWVHAEQPEKFLQVLKACVLQSN